MCQDTVRFMYPDAIWATFSRSLLSPNWLMCIRPDGVLPTLRLMPGSKASFDGAFDSASDRHHPPCLLAYVTWRWPPLFRHEQLSTHCEVILGTAVPNYKTIFNQLLSAWPYKICGQNETYPSLINEILLWRRHFMFTFMCLQTRAKIRIGLKWLVDRKRRIALVMLSYHKIVWLYITVHHVKYTLRWMTRCSGSSG